MTSGYVSFERDIYPAFTSRSSGEVPNVLDLLITHAAKSISEADTVFRSMNWSWPQLIARARPTSEEGIAILERYTRLLTVLLRTCSRALVRSIAQCKAVIRCVVRGLHKLSPNVVLEYLETLDSVILSSTPSEIRECRGFLLDKAAIDQLLIMCECSSEEDESTSPLREKCFAIAQKVICVPKLFSEEVLVDFLVRLTKSFNANDQCADFVSVVLESHNSGSLYDLLMGRVGFLQFSVKSVVHKLRVINFLTKVVSSRVAGGSEIPSCVTKSELTTSIINVKPVEKLVSLFSLRLLRQLLVRQRRSSTQVHNTSPSKDYKLIELSALVPVLKQFLNSSENLHQSTLFVGELCAVVVAYKRVFPGSFAEYKFGWAKLCLDAKNLHAKLIINFLVQLMETDFPLTAHVTLETIAKVFECIEEANESLSSFAQKEMAISFFFGNPVTRSVIEDCLGSASVWKNTMIKYGSRLNCAEFVKSFVACIIEDAEQIAVLPISRRLNYILSSDRVVPSLNGLNLMSKLLKGHSRFTRKSLETEDSIHVSPKKARIVEDTPNGVAGWLDWARSLRSEGAVDLVLLAGDDRKFLFQSVLNLSSCNVTTRTTASKTLSLILRATAMSIADRQSVGQYPFRELPQLAFALTWLRNGIVIESEGSLPEPIPAVVTHVVVEMMKLLFEPSHALYMNVCRFILGSPSLNVTKEIPMWFSAGPMVVMKQSRPDVQYNAFYATSADDLRVSRLWILTAFENVSPWDKSSVTLMIRKGAIPALMQAAVSMQVSESEFACILQTFANLLRDMNAWSNAAEKVVFYRKFNVIGWLDIVARSKLLTLSV